MPPVVYIVGLELIEYVVTLVKIDSPNDENGEFIISLGSSTPDIKTESFISMARVLK